LGAISTAAIFMLCVQSAEAGTAMLVVQQPATTSAGIFDASGRLVRTLWSGRPVAGGKLELQWDGRDDEGAAVPVSGAYSARVLAHDIHYVWEGVIGNTSSDRTGPGRHRAFNVINDMATDAQGRSVYVVGYNEQQPAIHLFQAASPQRQTPLAHDDYMRTFHRVATDGVLVYAANAGTRFNPETFVIALGGREFGEHRFANGAAVMPALQRGNRWDSVIDRGETEDTAASGLAVQRTGVLLFVAHRGANEIRLFDKRDGRPAGRIEVGEPGDIKVAPDDSLWVICGIAGKRAVAHYRMEEGLWVRSSVLTDGLTDPVAVGVSPLTGDVIVADAAREQLLAFDHNGRPLWTLGSEGGYRSGGPEVRQDRLWLSAGPTYIAFATDGSFWVGDPGNVRNLHFSPSRQLLGQIMYLPKNYVAAVDRTDPRRVFSHFLEFRVDYSPPLQSSWTLVRNWAAGQDVDRSGTFSGVRDVATLNNGRTYAVVLRDNRKEREVVELASAGLRSTGIRLRAGEQIEADGSMRSQRQADSLRVLERPLAGFAGNGNPQWGPEVEVARIDGLQRGDPYPRNVPLVAGVNDATTPRTASGVLVSFDAGLGSGFHLGGILPGTTRWLWRASPAGTWQIDLGGMITSRDGTYETGRGVQYAGNTVRTSGRHIVYGYHGEAWNGGQANQWLHFYDNGLFIGQFGRPVYPAANRTSSLPESAGNAFSPELVTVDGRLYLWHNDESVHGGVHRWRIENTDSLVMLEAPISPR